jgi:hypothetical protein
MLAYTVNQNPADGGRCHQKPWTQIFSAITKRRPIGPRGMEYHNAQQRDIELWDSRF